MNFKLNDPRTNWKFIAIVAVLGLVVGGEILWYANSPTPTPQPIEIPNIKKAAPQQTVDTFTSALSEVEGWQTYRNEEFGFEVRYPSGWVIKPYPEYVVYFDDNETRTTTIVITYLNNAVRGISYCEAYPEDVPRCEKLQAGNITIIVDWDSTVPDMFSSEFASRSASALVNISNEVALDIQLNDLTYEMSSPTKEFFRTFLSTFRFVEPTSQTLWDWELLGCGSSAPCSYKVCSLTDPANCYSCVGKYDPVSRGEKTPTSTTDPVTTTDFMCAKEMKKPVIPMNKQSCEVKGGTWGRFGLAQVELCNLLTSDANKTCTDSSQCESVCVADGNILPDAKTTGKCYGWTETLGTCLNYVNNGEAGGTLCAD